MPVRLRITLLFVALVVFILGIVCTGIYYFSYTSRINSIKNRLTNRAITTARLLYQREIFDQHLVSRIDSLTTISLKNKTVQAYDSHDHAIYRYSDIAGDTLQVEKDILEEARKNKIKYFTKGLKEGIAYYHAHPSASIVVISAAEDVEGRSSLRVLLNILLTSFLAGNAVVLVAGYFFSARLLRPVRKIASDVNEISALNLTRRLKTGKSKDEWNQLSSTLNQLLNRLQESFELQRRFISNASHELSTPLTSIMSQLEVSLQREREASQYKNVMLSIYHDVQQMSKLTRTLLEFAKASGNAGGLTIELLRVDEILLRLPAEMIKVNAGYTVSLRFDDLPENEESLLVFGNEELLSTAIKNIVLNACKYSPDHQATVSLNIEKRFIQIIISDNGPGIPETDLETIFQPFFRVAENVTHEGFGLGLSLAEKIVKLHKGTIRVESTINVGTRFTIILSAAKSPQP